LRSEVNGIEAYTASLKGAAIVSSSQQITNYNLFAVTSSANTFYGNQTITGSLNVGAGNITVLRSVGGAAVIVESTATSGEATLTLTGKNSSGTVRSSILKYDNADVLRLGSASPIPIQFETNDVARISIASGISSGDGSVTINTGNLIMGTSGKGIDFSATSNGSGTTTSELLNDYEEGEWTPTFTTGTSGTITVDTVNTKARYTKIGRQVTVAGSFYVTSVSSPVGEWRIQGLPFTSNTGASLRSAVSVFADGLETTATTSIVGYVDPNVTYITLYKYAAGIVSTMAADVKAGSYVFLTATYNV
jgi:hypothetical protein